MTVRINSMEFFIMFCADGKKSMGKETVKPVCHCVFRESYSVRQKRRDIMLSF